MKHGCVKEQKRYTKKELQSIFSLCDKEVKEFIKKLKGYGILKAVKANKEQLDLSDLIEEDIEVIDEQLDGSKYLYVFIFVGIVTVGSIVIECYPKYITKQHVDEADMKQIIKVLKKFSVKDSQDINFYNGENQTQPFNLLPIILYLFEDYYENGVYIKHEEIVEVNGEGNILWDKTIDEISAVLNNNQPVYLEMYTDNVKQDDADYFTKLHECILSNMSAMLEKNKLLRIFDLVAINLNDSDLSEFGEVEYILYRLQKELSTQFNTRKQLLLKTLYAYISRSETQKSTLDVSLYGTNKYHIVWEKVCSQVLGNVLHTKISELNIKIPDENSNLKEKTLMEIIDKPLWVPYSSEEGCKATKTLTPDLVSIYKQGEQYCFSIFDAKYYNIILNQDGVTSYPGVGDVTKQYLYQLAYAEFVSLIEGMCMKNTFLFPTDEDGVQELGSVEFSILKSIIKEGPNKIKLIKLPSKKMYEWYLADIQIDIPTVFPEI